VHGPDIHLCQPEPVDALLLKDRINPVLELRRRLLGERERDDVARLDAGKREDRRDPL